MPAIVLGKPKQSEAMWDALKKYIMRERQKKREEQEAEVEVERQRKERERQQKQDVMTLGETREQISQLELKLAQLKEEKHQLFLQLKKVLNEDDNRRRQLVKENNEMMNMHGYPAMGIGGHHQIFLQQNMSLGRSPIYKVGPHHGPPHSLMPPVGSWYLDHCTPGAIKRSHSPSPPPQPYHPYGYKQAQIPGYPPPKMEDGRRGPEYVRAVLWNKNVHPQAYYTPHPAQVPASSNVGYSPAPAQTVYTYSSSQPYGQPSHVAVGPPPRDENVTKPSPHIYLGQPSRGSVTTGPLPHPPQGYVTPLHDQHNPPKASSSTFVPASESGDKFYSSVRPATHVPIHGGAIPIQQAPQGSKTGGITTGYPIRGQPLPPTSHITTAAFHQPSSSTTHITSGLTMDTPHSVYVSQPSSSTRLLYTQSTPTQAAPVSQPSRINLQQREI